MTKAMTEQERTAARAPLRAQRRVYERKYGAVFEETITTVCRVRGIRKQEMQPVPALILEAMQRHAEALVAGGEPPMLEPEVEALVDRLVRLDAAVTDLNDKIEALSGYPKHIGPVTADRYQCHLRCILPNLDDRGAPL